MRPSNRVFSECCDGITRQQPSSLPKKLHNGLGRAAHRPRSGPFGAIPYNMGKGFAQLLGIWSWRLAPDPEPVSCLATRHGAVTSDQSLDFWQDGLKYTRAMG